MEIYGFSRKIARLDIESIGNHKSLAKTGNSLIKDAYTGVRKWRPLLWKLETGKIPSHEFHGTIHLEIPTRFPFELIKGARASLVSSEKCDPGRSTVPVTCRQSQIRTRNRD